MELKIKCQCGVKYALDVTPQTLANPIQFLCQYCGVDSSAAVNEIIRQQFKASVLAPTDRLPSAPLATAPAVATTATGTAPPPPPPQPASTKLRVQAQTHAAPEASELSGENAPVGKPCLKHPGNFATEDCLVCHKPICPKCMELFGYVCSAYCQSQAEKLKIDVPVFADQKVLVERSNWRKVRWLAAATVVMVRALLGAYSWYDCVGSRPRVLYTLR